MLCLCVCLTPVEFRKECWISRNYKGLWTYLKSAGNQTQDICKSNSCWTISPVSPRVFLIVRATSMRPCFSELLAIFWPVLTGPRREGKSMCAWINLRVKKTTSSRKGKFCFRGVIYLVIISKDWYRIFWQVPAIHRSGGICLAIWQTVPWIHSWNILCQDEPTGGWGCKSVGRVLVLHTHNSRFDSP